MKGKETFSSFRKRKEALAKLQRISHFDDDAVFEVKVDGGLPLKERVKAPSRIVLEHALYRSGVDKFRIRGPSASG